MSYGRKSKERAIRRRSAGRGSKRRETNGLSSEQVPAEHAQDVDFTNSRFIGPDIETARRPRGVAQIMHFAHTFPSADQMPNLRPTHHRQDKRIPERRRAAARTGRTAEGDASTAAADRIDPAILPGARAATMPRRLDPQLATRTNAAPTGDGWLHEIKFDGYRLLARVEGRAIRLFSRNGKDWTARFPELCDTLGDLEIGEAFVDGELVALQSDGTSSFRQLQEALSANRTAGLIYEVFDLPYLDGYDLTGAPLEARKLLLRDLLASRQALNHRGQIRYVQHFEGQGDALYDEVCQLGLEGIMSKRRESRYRSGRSSDWLKVKSVQQGEFVVGGFTDPSNARIGFGALLLGAYNDRQELCYIGSVGTGFSAQRLRTLYQDLREIEIDWSPFALNAPLDAVRGAHWVKPELVADVEFTEWTRDGVLRHPVFRGLREDRDPDEIVLAGGSAAAETLRIEQPPKGARMTKPPRARATHETVAGIRLTHPDRILYADQGVTKAHLARYYEQVADRILPHLANRPLTLVRCPDGQHGSCFYQKHPPDGLSDAVGRIEIDGSDGASSEYMYVDSLPGLVSLVQIGALELHVWGSTIDALETPDTVVFDLDPGPGVTWPRLIEGADAVEKRLAALGFRSYPKLTGGKGLHVIVPLLPREKWDRVKEFTRAVAEGLARERPEHFTANMAKSKRHGRIFIDYLRNGRGATAVAAYSTRARPGASVAVPIGWEELDPASRSDRYGIDTVRRRLAALRKDPWPDYERARRAITAETLEAAGMRG
jgi:bifunctional non-homologous end joining protein LigD